MTLLLPLGSLQGPFRVPIAQPSAGSLRVGTPSLARGFSGGWLRLGFRLDFVWISTGFRLGFRVDFDFILIWI